MGCSPSWLVVGAGLSGATMAERLATQLDQKVLVVDRRAHVAGNAYDETDDNGVRVHRYGAHIFHTKSERVWAYLSRFTDWLPYVHRVLTSVDGDLLPLPCNLATLRSLLPDSADHVSQALCAEFGPGARVPVLTMCQHADPLVRSAGEVVYQKLFLGYTTKQWGLRPEDLDRSVTGRVPVLLSADRRYFQDAHQGIPRDGYTAMVSRMLDHPNIRVRLGCDYRDLGGPLTSLPTVYTGPIDEFFGGAHGSLPYRSLRFEHRHLAVDRVQPVAVVNHPNEHAYTRVIEHAHFSAQHLGATTLTYEYPEPHQPGRNEPYYPVPRPENHRRYSLYQARASSLGTRVLFVGRLAEYRYYDMDQAVAHALAIFDHRVLGGQTGGPAELPGIAVSH